MPHSGNHLPVDDPRDGGDALHPPLGLTSCRSVHEVISLQNCEGDAATGRSSSWKCRATLLGAEADIVAGSGDVDLSQDFQPVIALEVEEIAIVQELPPSPLPPVQRARLLCHEARHDSDGSNVLPAGYGLV